MKLGILFAGLFVLAMSAFSVVGSYNSLVSEDEAVKGYWDIVNTQYQRRADLIPNLVEVVKGYVDHEHGTLVDVIKARASATQAQLPKEAITDPKQFEQFQAQQGAITQALGRLLVVSEQYPNLKADKQFRTLSSNLEGTENRIAVARRDYILHARAFNAHLRRFPINLINSWFAGLQPAGTFEIDEKAKQAPQVKMR